MEVLKANALQKATRKFKAGGASSTTSHGSKTASEDSGASEGSESTAPKKRGRPRKSKAAATQPQDAKNETPPGVGGKSKSRSTGPEQLEGSKAKRAQARKRTQAGSAAEGGTAADQASTPSKRGRPK